MEKFPKFIIESREKGNCLIISKCTYHKDLAIDITKVKGGGFWTLDISTSTFTLYGESHDFGVAKFEDIKKCISYERVYSDSSLYRNITSKFKFQYKKWITKNVLERKLSVSIEIKLKKQLIYFSKKIKIYKNGHIKNLNTWKQKELKFYLMMVLNISYQTSLMKNLQNTCLKVVVPMLNMITLTHNVWWLCVVALSKNLKLTTTLDRAIT